VPFEALEGVGGTTKVRVEVVVEGLPVVRVAVCVKVAW
jgi:hypothetical protein